MMYTLFETFSKKVQLTGLRFSTLNKNPGTAPGSKFSLISDRTSAVVQSKLSLSSGITDRAAAMAQSKPSLSSGTFVNTNELSTALPLKSTTKLSGPGLLVSLVWLLLLASPITLFAQAPSGYYQQAAGKSGAALKTALYEILSDPYSEQSYAFLYTIFERSDTRADGKLWDMYSTCTWEHGVKRCGNYSKVCDCYNREHSVPASWFSDRAPMYTDAHHLFPTDGYVNNQRGNHPFGECTGGTTLPNGRGRRGTSTFPGYTDIVFEPVDEFKGDFARTYFYFATRYENIMTTMSSTTAKSFNLTTYPSLSSWSIQLFLKWHRQDPVSQKEITRNNVIFEYQENRNAFIDHPILAEYIWGTLIGTPWNITSVTSPAEMLARIHYNSSERSMRVAADLGALSYEVVSVSGQRMLSGEMLGGDEVSVASLPPGVYFFRIASKNVKVAVKFLIFKD